jgi:hypothetical protein
MEHHLAELIRLRKKKGNYARIEGKSKITMAGIVIKKNKEHRKISRKPN